VALAIIGAIFVFSQESAALSDPSCPSCSRFGTMNENWG